MTGRFVAYYRVSTVKQGASGLGLDAQKAAVRQFLKGGAWELVGEFEEVESGKDADRPALAAAMELCALTGARLVIAKLDRLSRSVHFLSGMMERGVDFVALDLPEANRLTLHIMAAVAQQEREAISARTRVALGAIKAKLEAGEVYVSRRSGRSISRLGSPRGLAVPRPDLGVAGVRAKADAFVERVGPTVRRLRADGLSLGSIAARLNAMRIKSARGGEWSPMAVKRVLDRPSRAWLG
jgi:DNA invertase Pin-like site-specific DNA recombinase